jgi:hypothetical protein
LVINKGVILISGMSVVKMFLLVVGGLLATSANAGPGGRNSGSITPMQEQFKLPITKANAPIQIDGKLDEQAWQAITGVSRPW